MLFRTAILASLIAFSVFINAQNNGPALKVPSCPAGVNCSSPMTGDGAPVLHTRNDASRFQIDDFKPSDASIICSVVKYEWNDVMPIVHLLCPGPQVFAPLRVHLTLSWKNESEVPEAIKTMRVETDRNSAVQFKSQPGESRVELTLCDAEETQTLKEWVKFTNVKVGLVPTPK
jgi:hypothetical protein